MRNAVNDGVALDTYLGKTFIVTYPSTDDFTDQVVRLGRGCCLYKVDINSSFSPVKMDPGITISWVLSGMTSLIPVWLLASDMEVASCSVSVTLSGIILKYDHQIINY